MKTKKPKLKEVAKIKNKPTKYEKIFKEYEKSIIKNNTFQNNDVENNTEKFPEV